MQTILKYRYWYFTKALSPEKCQEIIKAASTKTQHLGTTYRPRKHSRKSTVAWVADPKIYNLLNPFIHSANKNAGWNFQWDWNESSQFTIYNKGDHYGWHIDTQPPNPSSNQNFKNKIRKLSLTLQLTDPSQYEGGDFQFKWLDKDAKVKIVTVKDARDLGTIIIFPSFIFHRITPITRGTRQSLVNWSVGKVFK